MEIFNFEDAWDTECCLAVNAIVLVLGEYQISTATYHREYLSSYKTSS